jgi:predicted secreted protein
VAASPWAGKEEGFVTWFTGTVVYLLIWWTALFAVLPFGTRPEPDGDPGAGGWRGTPRQPHLGRKLLATTVVSAAIWLAVYGLVESDWISFRSGWLALPEN